MSFIRLINVLILLTFYNNALAIDVPIYEFPIKNYSQNIEDFISYDTENYYTPLVDKNLQHLKAQEFYNHYFAGDSKGLSPWNKSMVKVILPLVKASETENLADFNQEKNNQHYGENFKEHDDKWLKSIKNNMQLDSIDSAYKKQNRAIAINNTLARMLPEHAPDFLHFSLPGQGFPFDNLQEASIWAGTPLYVLHFTKDKAWALVLTPDCYFAWINTNDFAYASENFIKKYSEAAKKGLIAITKTGLPILDSDNNFKFLSYIGSVFPLDKQNDANYEILIPVKDKNNNAIIARAKTAKSNAGKMPLTLSRKNMANLITELKERPYGWGGAYFFNDCSQEMKNLFTPFGIWLPRNSAQQAYLNQKTDLSSFKLKDRLNGIKSLATPLTTLIYTEQHIMLYIGNKKLNKEIVPITYQNVWGLSPKSKDKRFVIGQAVFLPILEKYPKVKVSSQADKHYLKLLFITAPSNAKTPESLQQAFIKANLSNK